jgi:membrane fusion protein (multidrug efflux system)
VSPKNSLEISMRHILRLAWIVLLIALAACGSGSDAVGPERGGRGEGRGGRAPQGVPGGSQSDAAVPVKVQPVLRGPISRHIETNGTLEAENEVDLVARIAGPIVELRAEQGDAVRKGQLLARIDDREVRNQVTLATVSRDEAKRAHQRAAATFESGLVSQEAYDASLAALEAAEAQLEAAQISLAYTEIRAPFDALIVNRFVRQAQHVTSGASLFRISDFDPLLCPIEVPEKDLPQVRLGQPGRIEVQAYPEQAFEARVLRLRPTVDAATGTLTVTLEVDGQGRLRPGMFASVFLETDTHRDALIIPRQALLLDSIGDAVFVRQGDAAVRRDVTLGFREGDRLEVLEGLAQGEEVIVLGQDGLADGTPVTVLDEEALQVAESRSGGTAPGQGVPGSPSPEQLEAMRQRMRERGFSEEEIEQRLALRREGGWPGRGGGRGRGGMGPGGPGGMDPGGVPPFLEQRIREASPEELESIRGRMRERGMSDQQIDEIVQRLRVTAEGSQ